MRVGVCDERRLFDVAEELYAPEIIQIIRDTDVLIGAHGAYAGTMREMHLTRMRVRSVTLENCRGRVGMGGVSTTRRCSIGTCIVRYVQEHVR